MTTEEEMRIYDMTSQYFVVIDVNLLEESNAILRANGLFQLNAAGRSNVRGSHLVEITPEIRSLLYNVSCYERVLHKALQMRMASLYERATGKPCIHRGRLAEFTSCLKAVEKRNLGDSWVF